MNIKCPECRKEIPLVDVNVSTDIALCRGCGQNFSYSDLHSQQTVTPANLEEPPKGTWFRRDINGFEVGATTRSPAAFFLVPFMCVWSGFSLGGIYGTQIKEGHFVLTQSLFGIPFLLGTLLFGSIAVMSVCGKMVLRVEGNQATTFAGVGPIGWKRRFEWSGVKNIRITQRSGKNGPISLITIEGDKPINFATGIKSERLEFMAAALRQMRQQYRS